MARRTIVETFCPECKKQMNVEIDLASEHGRIPALLQYGKYCDDCKKTYSDEGDNYV